MLGNILGIVGLILTLIFGIYSIWIARKTNKKVSLGLEKKECYSLFKQDINRLKIDVKYNNEIVENYLILFKGVLINNGKTDIDKSRIYKPLQLNTKKNYKWLETNVYEKPDGSSITLNKSDDTTIELSWDLLKAGEKIEFESLIEVPNNIEIDEISDDFYNSIEFDFRITDINRIDKLSEINIREKRNLRQRNKMLYISIFTFLAGIYIFFSPELPENISLLTSKKEIKFEVLNRKDTINAVLYSKKDNIVTIKNDNLIINKNISDFNDDYKILKIDKTISEHSLFNRIMGGLYIVLSILSFLLFYKIKKLPSTGGVAKKRVLGKIQHSEL
ncbi:hypothetical protein [Pedobacter cryophilus]|uniref:Uncharacterized protein n=1 Tax=Pedobacter cryophilus TaxID=2571271 RepID=A0A4U1BV84_9SPHI|nr:hypothetical protein [Pedobacter cryophilus]TKB96021.1 hypothetical protein FA046_15250 [Pedobacter cryophilus]